MTYKQIFIDRNNSYSVGIDIETNNYIMEVIITSKILHSRYFTISKEEFDYFNTNKKNILDNLAKLFSGKGIQENNNRFIMSNH